MIKFECHAKRPDGEKLYRLVIDGRVVREGLTIDEVIRAINARDEESEAINRRDEDRLGEDHGPRGRRKAVREPEVRR